MWKTYALASALAMVRHTLGGFANGLGATASFTEHALTQVCEDINNARAKRVAEDPNMQMQLASKRESLN